MVSTVGWSELAPHSGATETVGWAPHDLRNSCLLLPQRIRVPWCFRAHRALPYAHFILMTLGASLPVCLDHSDTCLLSPFTLKPVLVWVINDMFTPLNKPGRKVASDCVHFTDEGIVM